NSLLHQLGIKKAVKFLQSTLVKVPVVIGYFKPVVLVPLSAFTGLTTQQMESVLVHELAHIIRRDYLINLIQSLAEILFFYHPAVWWISKTIKEEREHCCDDIALEHTGDSLNFVKALAGIQEQMLHSEGLAMALSGNNNKLLKRIQRLINQPKMKTNFIEGFTASCLIFLGIFILLLNSNAASSFSVMSTLSDRNFANESSMPGFSEPNAVFPQDTLLTKKEEKKRKEAKIKAEKEQKSAELEQKQAEIEQKQAEQEKQKAEFNEQRARLEKERAERDAERAEREAERAERDIERAELEQLRMERQLESEEAMDELADEIARGVQEGLQEMDLDVIVDETMTGIEAGLNEIDFNGIVQEALNGINEGVANMDFNLIVDEVVSGVKATLIEMDLNSIVNEVTMEVKNAMQDMNTNKSTNTGVTVRETNISENPFIGNSAHLEILNRGVAAWNTWRKNNQDIIPDLSGAVLTAYNLRDINFYKATLVFADFKEVSFDFADLRKANLEGANCKEASFFEAKLQEANFTGANLKEVDLSGMDLRKTCFAYANLKEATLAHANLQGAIFKGANLKEANLYKTDFRNADLSDVDYSEAQVEGADFSGALYNSTTFFPSGFNPDAHGMKKN
ncbi:MAG: pentapeptide repeat-containing protein, partial [Bacteroidales bacterium]|nr:pentapeptide repeat-containing protein [Bacteroidales bacterium]